MAKYPDSTKASLEQRLRARARERWPQIASLQVRHRGIFSYVDATLTDATTLKLCRLRYVGSAHQWQFAIYRASHDDYDESVFFTGLPVGTCQDALDTACGLYLNDPTAWIRHPTNLRARPLSNGAYADARAHATEAAMLAPRPGQNHGIAALAATYAGDLEAAATLNQRLAAVATSPTPAELPPVHRPRDRQRHRPARTGRAALRPPHPARPLQRRDLRRRNRRGWPADNPRRRRPHRPGAARLPRPDRLLGAHRQLDPAVDHPAQPRPAAAHPRRPRTRAVPAGGGRPRARRSRRRQQGANPVSAPETRHPSANPVARRPEAALVARARARKVARQSIDRHLAR